ncbi:hypothetical protein PH242_04785 [Photorhabdus bodei]|uniref:capsular polysaccharide export protein, LipB/KpsS family n=2 Tax=Photorhabdus bodei TaxID=2029681 RepID=UPI00232F153C|nr:hypothetical protein [Photorhabdus bodei]MDB6367011.1 hypothetical protein [Photorhabdus bodei]
MKKILVYIDNLERLNFFSRFECNKNYSLIYITSRLSIYLKLFFKKKKVYITKKKYITKSNLENYIIKDNSDIIEKRLSNRSASSLAYSIYSALKKAQLYDNITAIYIWNGNNTLGKTLTYFSDEKKIPKLYFEISNLPNSIFVDPLGVNAKSKLFSNISFLNYSNNKRKVNFNIWKKEYREYKKKPLPQALKKNKLNHYFLLDCLGWCTFFSKDLDISWIINNIYSKMIDKKTYYNVKTNKNKLNYVFLPLQVSTDSQLTINSDYSNIDIIKYAIDHCERNELELIIKPHPAEKTVNIKEYINLIIENENCQLSNEDTVELIENSKAVIVNNSTVGLESLLLEKKTIFLGRSIFAKMDKNMIENYIFDYLINGLDYFSDQEIPLDILDNIFDRIKY